MKGPVKHTGPSTITLLTGLVFQILFARLHKGCINLLGAGAHQIQCLDETVRRFLDQRIITVAQFLNHFYRSFRTRFHDIIGELAYDDAMFFDKCLERADRWQRNPRPPDHIPPEIRRG